MTASRDAGQNPSRASDQFTTVAAVVAVLGCLLAIASPYLAVDQSSEAFRGSSAATGLVGLIFAGQNLRVLRDLGSPRLPPAAITTVLGLWFAVSPLTYTEIGFVPTAGIQFAGLLAAGFAGYNALEAVE